jgi:hypothetical protein
MEERGKKKEKTGRKKGPNKYKIGGLKTTCHEGGKISFSDEGADNIVGPNY